MLGLMAISTQARVGRPFLRRRLVVVYAIVIIFASLATLWVVEYLYFAIVQSTWSWFGNNPMLVLGNASIIAAAMVFSLCFSGNIGISVLIPASLLVALSYASKVKFVYRIEPIYPEDLMLASEMPVLSTMITKDQLDPAIRTSVILLILFFIALFFLPYVKIKAKGRAIGICASIAVLLYCVMYMRSVQPVSVVILVTSSSVLFYFLLVLTKERWLNCSYIKIGIGATGGLILFAAYLYLGRFSWLSALITAILAACSCMLLVHLRINGKTITNLDPRRYTPICAAALALVLFCSSTNPFYFLVSRYGDMLSGRFGGGDYGTNGFLLGFLRRVNAEYMARPLNYGKQDVQQITQEYMLKAQAYNTALGNSDMQFKPHVVYIMSEAFSDPTRFEELSFSEDPIPYIRSLMEENPSGYACVPSFVGGTQLSEFEALTGLYTKFLSNSDVFRVVSHHKSFPSIVSYLKEQDYSATAIHPLLKSFYRRDYGYATMAFDQFIGIEDAKYTYKVTTEKYQESDRSYISDDAAFVEVLDVLESSDSPQFVHLVTVQNHGPYDLAWYDKMIHVEGMDKPADESMGIYSTGLRLSDIALEKFCDRIQEFKEPIIVLFWGDHLPAGYPEDFFSDQRYYRMQYETPLLFFANFPLGKERLGTISNIYFQDILTDYIGAPKTPFHMLLGELRQHMRGGQLPLWYIDADNRMHMIYDLDGNSVSELDEETQALLNKLMIVQHDLVSGENLANSAGFFSIPVPPEGIEGD